MRKEMVYAAAFYAANYTGLNEPLVNKQYRDCHLCISCPLSNIFGSQAACVKSEANVTRKLYPWSSFLIVDGVLGIRTQDGRTVGADESTELWRIPPWNSLL